jgi:hypothetical protein
MELYVCCKIRLTDFCINSASFPHSFALLPRLPPFPTTSPHIPVGSFFFVSGSSSPSASQPAPVQRPVCPAPRLHCACAGVVHRRGRRVPSRFLHIVPVACFWLARSVAVVLANTTTRAGRGALAKGLPSAYLPCPSWSAALPRFPRRSAAGSCTRRGLVRCRRVGRRRRAAAGSCSRRGGAAGLGESMPRDTLSRLNMDVLD